MPSIYADLHDKFVENYVNANETKSLISDRIVMVKNKMNYLIPAHLTVKVNSFIVCKKKYFF